jgi:hypothetical protein
MGKDQQQQQGPPRFPSDALEPEPRSKSIPIQQSVLKRTPSEQRLREDEEVAEIRDFLMFRRIADGISRKQEETRHQHPRMVNEMCLASIIGTRRLSEDELVRGRQSSFLTRGDSPTPSAKRRPAHSTEKSSFLDPSTCKWIISTTPHPISSSSRADKPGSCLADEEMFPFEL